MGAKINGEERPLRMVLRNGDVVEVMTSDRAAPAPGGEALTNTGRARAAQRRLERQARREEFYKLGRDLVTHALHRYGHDLADTSLAEAIERLGRRDEEDLFIGVGEGSVKANAVAVAAFPGLKDSVHKDELRRPMDAEKARIYVNGGKLTSGVGLHFAECCSPIPGDRIIGVHAPGKGVLVHTIDCEKLEAHESSGEAWFDLSWTQTALDRTLAVSRIIATVENARGVLGDLCRIIAEHEGDILNVRMTRRSEDFFDMMFDVEVADARHLTHILAAMRASKAVKQVERVRGAEQ
jgi:GTP pyrophosphokinase/guanosine-3',5'-bis(diphosphate) 3'-pyrophosphohydrolase